MASIQEHLDKIKNAVFGKDVRQSIHDGLHEINQETESTSKKQEKLERTFNDLIINAGNSNAEVAAARNGFETLGKRLDGVDSQLDTIETDNIHTLWRKKTEYVAHRGLHLLAPENSILAIRLAGRYGFKMVELDIAKTFDGEFILMHDDTVDRTTDGTGRVDSMTLAEIKNLNIDEYFSGKESDDIIKVPTFEEACNECAKAGIGINVDMSKLTFNNDDIISVVETMKKYNIYNKSLFCCTDIAKRERLITLYPDAGVFWLNNSTDTDATILEVKKYKNGIVAHPYNVLTENMLNEYTKNGLQVYVYSANIKSIFQRWGNKIRFIETDTILINGGGK